MNSKHIATIEWVLVTVLAVIVMLGIFYVAHNVAGITVPDVLEPIMNFAGAVSA